MTDLLSNTAQQFSDRYFDDLYPRPVQRLSEKHWTPVRIAVRAAGFLAEQTGSRILDIGSGSGKFCLVAGQHYPDSHFFGVEQRKKLVQYAEKAKKRASIENTTFIHDNFTNLDINRFDHFYFYNSFYENLVDEAFRIDQSVDYSLSRYTHDTRYLFKLLSERPKGTRLAVYHSFGEIIPPAYKLVKSCSDASLSCWIKE